MKQQIKYSCEHCGKSFNTQLECTEHEQSCKVIKGWNVCLTFYDFIKQPTVSDPEIRAYRTKFIDDPRAYDLCEFHTTEEDKTVKEAVFLTAYHYSKRAKNEEERNKVINEFKDIFRKHVEKRFKEAKRCYEEDLELIDDVITESIKG